jgi:hypothetical protein
MQRRYKTVAITLFLAGLIAAPLAAVEAVVQETTGKVELKEQGGSWEPAAVGDTISRGTFISTGFNSKAILELGGSTLEVQELTRMQLEQIVEENEAVSTDLFLKVGKVRAEVQSTEGLRNNFKVRGPVSTAAVRGTTFVFDGYTLWVEEGTVIFTNLIGQRRSVVDEQESTTDGYTPPADTRATLLDDQFEVQSTLSGDGGLVNLKGGDSGTTTFAVLNLTWE